MENELAQLRAEAAALRGVLRGFGDLSKELISDDEGYEYVRIPYVQFATWDAQRIAALTATDAGRPLLRRLRQAERERDEARAIVEALDKVTAAVAGQPPPEKIW